MQITFMSNVPGVGSGYGQQGELLVKRLLREGHEVAVASNFGVDGRIVETEDNVRVYPRGVDQYGITLAPSQHAHFMSPKRPSEGWLLALYDAWPLKAWGEEIFDRIPIAGWYPIDHIPAPPPVVDVARKTRLVIAMSRFGQEQLKIMGVDARYAPHAVDTAVFHPGATVSAGDFREKHGIPADAYLVSTIAANTGNTPARKGWGEMAFSMAGFMREHADVYWYIHAFKPGIRGIPLEVLTQAAGIPEERLRWVDQFAYSNGMIPDAAMAAVYSTTDVHLLTSYGEGFGIPVIEAAACGTPSIVSNGTAQRELVGSGWLVSIEPFWDHNAGSWFHRPSVHSIRERLEESYADRGNAERRAAAQAFALEYDADAVFERYWKPILAEMEAALVEEPAVARAERRRAEKAARRAAARRSPHRDGGPGAGHREAVRDTGGRVMGVPPSTRPPMTLEEEEAAS